VPAIPAVGAAIGFMMSEPALGLYKTRKAFTVRETAASFVFVRLTSTHHQRRADRHERRLVHALLGRLLRSAQLADSRFVLLTESDDVLVMAPQQLCDVISRAVAE
jgi:hypothetical protein